jgi:predicted nicotinamide N-methyase
VPDADLDTLVDQVTQEEFERSDERLPYFATIWPAAEALVAVVLASPPLNGKHVLDLGCGLGPCGFAAAARGARVTFFDWEPRALAIVAASAGAPGQPVGRFDFVVGDWRRPPALEPFDLILGADVLYERRNGPAVAAFLARHLRPGAEAWIADPGRPYAASFPALAQQQGLELLGSQSPPPHLNDVEVTIIRLRRPRGSSGARRGQPAPGP